MKRDLESLTEATFDVLVVGGGIFGAWAVWDATVRGLRAALVERDDFVSGTSANSLKILHGGFRDLARLRPMRARQGVEERSIWMRLAPHLVRPLPVLIPLRSGWRFARPLLTPLMSLYDALGYDRNRGLDPDVRISRSRTVDRAECVRIAPWLDPTDLGAGIVFHDAQIFNTERMVVGLLRSAARRGARVANYVKVAGLTSEGGRVTGARAVDRVTGRELEIRAAGIVACVGPWLGRFLGTIDGGSTAGDTAPESAVDVPPLLKGLNVFVDRELSDHAVGLLSATRSAGAHTGFDREERYLFLTPWRHGSIIGTRYFEPRAASGEVRPRDDEVRALLDEVRSACPALDFGTDDVVFTHAGLIPAQETDAGEPGRIVSEAQIRCHRESGLAGLVSVVGPKYTAARRVAAAALDRLVPTLRRRVSPSRTASEPLFGAEEGRFPEWLASLRQRCADGLAEERLRRLAHSYGSAAGRVLEEGGYFDDSDADRDAAANRAESRHAVRREMAVKLGDTVFRRTDIGSAGNPGRDALLTCAEAMAEELGWSERRKREEVGEVLDCYSRILPLSGEPG